MAYRKPRNNANLGHKSTVSILCLPLCQHQFAPSGILLCVSFNYYRRLNFNLQVITDSNRQLARLLGKVQILLYRKLFLAILHWINPYPVAITDQLSGFRIDSCVWLHVTQFRCLHQKHSPSYIYSVERRRMAPPEDNRVPTSCCLALIRSNFSYLKARHLI